MKKFLAKLALFTITSIVLAMPLQAWAAECIDKTAESKEKDYITTIIEEPFGEASKYNGGETAETLAGKNADFFAKDCCRATHVYHSEYNGTRVEPGLFTVDKDGKCEATPACTNEKPKNATDANSVFCTNVLVLFSKGGTSLIEGYISIIYTWAASIVGLIAVTVIIISGIQIAISGGDSTALDAGKNRIIKSLSGLAVLFLSGLILYTINPNFFTR